LNLGVQESPHSLFDGLPRIAFAVWSGGFIGSSSHFLQDLDL
jgi:hypothetical protein